jgi:hypothetical protein
MMNGKTTGVFTNEVTHLITTEVGSAKYHVCLVNSNEFLIS